MPFQKTSRSKLLFFTILVPILIGIGIWQQCAMRREAANSFKEFNAAAIDGKLEKVGYYSKATEITLDDGQIYVFHPYTNAVLNQDKIFKLTAKKGDRIVKPAYNDTLYLYTANQKLKYTFR